MWIYIKFIGSKKVFRNKNEARLFYGSSNEYFDYDKIVFATHADEALKLINNPTENERKILTNFSAFNLIKVLSWNVRIICLTFTQILGHTGDGTR